MNTTTVSPQYPKFLGLWARCIREASNWSQEALAASSGLDVRTIQRIEAGRSVSITTRRALARGLGYDNRNVFDDPEFIKFVHEFFDDIKGIQKGIQDESIQKQFPNHIRLSVNKVESGEALARLVYDSEGHVFHADDSLSQEAKEIAASIFDYLSDLGDISDDVSFSDKVGFHRELDGMLKELLGLGAICYTGLRSAKMVGANWVNQTAIPFKVGYLTVVPKDKTLSEMMVPRHFS